jgi:succinoglycan biosynthesis protein ExoO
VRPDVSIIIAAYNAETTLDRAIGSALAQRNVTVEIIVVDDRSRDSTLDVARSYAPALVRAVALPENRGPGGARNAGLDLASGRWVAILDADDAIYPDRIATMIARAQRARAEIAVDNMRVIPEDGTAAHAMFPAAYLEQAGEFSLADFIEGNLVFESRFNLGYLKPIFERAFLTENALRYDEKLSIGEDYLLLASALARGGKCVVEPAVGYAYHIRTGSISRVLELHHLEAMREADRVFATAHMLDARSQAAFAKRSRSLRRAASFLSLVQHIKARSPLKAMRAALSDPSAVRHLGMPIAKRLRGVAAQFAGSGSR